MIPTPEHVVFIPGVLLLGVFIGYTMGSRAVRDEVRLGAGAGEAVAGGVGRRGGSGTRRP